MRRFSAAWSQRLTELGDGGGGWQMVGCARSGTAPISLDCAEVGSMRPEREYEEDVR